MADSNQTFRKVYLNPRVNQNFKNVHINPNFVRATNDESNVIYHKLPPILHTSKKLIGETKTAAVHINPKIFKVPYNSANQRWSNMEKNWENYDDNLRTESTNEKVMTLLPEKKYEFLKVGKSQNLLPKENEKVFINNSGNRWDNLNSKLTTTCDIFQVLKHNSKSTSQYKIDNRTKIKHTDENNTAASLLKEKLAVNDTKSCENIIKKKQLKNFDKKGILSFKRKTCDNIKLLHTSVNKREKVKTIDSALRRYRVIKIADNTYTSSKTSLKMVCAPPKKKSRKSLSSKSENITNYSKIIVIMNEKFQFDPAKQIIQQISNLCSKKQSNIKTIYIEGKKFVLSRPGTFVFQNSHYRKKAKFLLNDCNNPDCLLSHEPLSEKMPVCCKFLRGCCTLENCLFLHVHSNPKTPICKAFKAGFCSLGNKCQSQHLMFCPEYEKYGFCEKQNNCPLYHRNRKKRHSFLSIPEDKQYCTNPLIERYYKTVAESDQCAIFCQNDKLSLTSLPLFISLRDYDSE